MLQVGALKWGIVSRRQCHWSPLCETPSEVAVFSVSSSDLNARDGDSPVEHRRSLQRLRVSLIGRVPHFCFAAVNPRWRVVADSRRIRQNEDSVAFRVPGYRLTGARL